MESVPDDDSGAFRYILTPYDGLSTRFAISAWGWTFEADEFVLADVDCFVKSRYRKAPEDVASSGSHAPTPVVDDVVDGETEDDAVEEDTDEPDPDAAEDAATPDDVPVDDDVPDPAETADADPGDTDEPDPPPEPVVVGYYPGWGVYSRHYYPHNLATVEDPGIPSNTIPGPYYSHLTYAFVNVSPAGFCTAQDPGAELPTGWKTFGPSTGIFEDLAALKAANPHLKILMSVGGWTYSQNFSDVAMTEGAREAFAQTCVQFMLEHGFDGIDIDWEHPTGNSKDGDLCEVGKDPCSPADKLAAANVAGDGTTYFDLDPNACVTCRPEDTANYTLLLGALRDELDAQSPEIHRPLTIAAGAGPAHVAALDVPGMAEHLDWIMVMAYDYHGGWESQTGFNSALTADDGTGFDVTSSVNAFLDAGLSPDQIVLGLPFYGRGWAGAADSAPGGAATPATGTLNAQTGEVQANGVVVGHWEAGSWGWRLLAENYLSPDFLTGTNGYTRYWDETAQAPYLHSAADGVWIGYDDPESIAAKLALAKELGLRGAMIWDVTSDDCDDTLAKAVNEGLGRVVDNAPPPGCP